MKEYQIKVYDVAGVYKNTINPLIVKTGISFSMNINGGQGELRIGLNKKFTENQYLFSDIVIVTVFDKNNDSKRIYRGHITRIKRTFDNKGEGIEISCLGSFAFMSRLFFRNGSSLVFNKNQLPSQTIKDIVDNFNFTYNYFTYTKIIDYSNSISIDFDYIKSGDAITKVIKATPLRWFYVDSVGDFTYRAKNSIIVNHRVKLDNEVDYFVADEEIETLYNKVYVKKTGPTSDSTSIAEYGIIETNIENDGTGSDYLEANKNYKKEIKVVINNKYNIESIEPGHYITLLNSDYETQRMQIVKVDYSYDKVSLSLEKYTTLPEVLSQ